MESTYAINEVAAHRTEMTARDGEEFYRELFDSMDGA
jgi:hypothetical protein